MLQQVISTSALHQCIVDNNKQALMQLLAQRTNVDERNHSGKTALHLAALLGLEGFVRDLLGANASIDIKDNEGVTPRDYAAWNFHLGVIKLLENNK
ncbi:hypothetical protein IFR05_017508, partial [Cadophora sp. M221]